MVKREVRLDRVGIRDKPPVRRSEFVKKRCKRRMRKLQEARTVYMGRHTEDLCITSTLEGMGH